MHIRMYRELPLWKYLASLRQILTLCVLISANAQTEPRLQPPEANCRRFRGEGESSSFAQDLKSAYLALGVSQVYEEFEQGNAAGSAAYRISPRVSWGFSFALFAFSLFVLLV